MIDINYYKKLFFNEETGKERYSLIQKEAVNTYKNNSVENSIVIAFECYNSDIYYIQAFGVFIMGLIASKNKKIYDFLKNEVSKNTSWQVQEFLAMAFDNYCKGIGYRNSLGVINDWLKCKNENNRRAAIEGLRIWTKRPYFMNNPEEAIKIISDHKDDTSDYVRRSAGNSLKDISKEFPELIKQEIDKWNLDIKQIKQVYKLASKFLEKY
ncbi:MAG: DNA alkylation repair protein [Treponema sp.]|nr:DNA alkylation repair protein [Treponema sp.]